MRLVSSLSFVDSKDDVLGIGVGQGDVSEVLCEATVDVACLKVMVVDLHRARKCIVLRVNEPGRLPLAAPKVGEVGVDTADVDLQVTVLVEAQAGTSSTVSVLALNVGVYSRLDASLVGGPLLVELLGEVAGVTDDGGRESVGVERELDAQLRVEVDKRVHLAIFAFLRVLSSDLRDHCDASIWQLDVLLVKLEVLLEGVLDVLVVQDLLVYDVGQVLEDHVHLGHGGRLDEVLHDFLLHAAHLVL